MIDKILLGEFLKTVHYKTVDELIALPDISDTVYLGDHLDGFNANLDNAALIYLDSVAQTRGSNILVWYHQIDDGRLTQRYPHLRFKYDHRSHYTMFSLSEYHIHPDLSYQNFICSFNITDHVSRKLLVAALHRMGWFNFNFCSKGFACSVDEVDGHIKDYVGDEDHLYRKFLIGPDTHNFFQSTNMFKYQNKFDLDNMSRVENKLTQSFVHVVAETMGTSYYPFVTEKFLQSIATRGLFVCYAQPGWHQHVEKYYGFKPYSRLFDYSFDTISNPIHRLLAMLSMLAKFSVLTPAEWHDLYLLEQDTIEYNYNHYFSGEWIRHTSQFNIG